MRATALIMVSPSQTIMASAIANQRKATRYTEMNLEVAYLHPSNPTIHRGVKNVFDDLALAMTDEHVVR